MEKKIGNLKIYLILIVAFISLIMLKQSVKSATYENIFEYELNSGVAIITKYIGDGSQVAVPAEIAGTTRIKIAKDVFESSSLKKIVILKNVTKIEQGAFSKNTKAVIYGKQDSGAEKYAKENSIEFRVYCDINGDNNVTATDSLKTKRHIVELSGQMLNEDEQIRADINCDEKVTTTDLLIIKKVIVGLDELDEEETVEQEEQEEEDGHETEDPIEFSEINWQKDYYWIDDDTEPWKIDYTNDKTSHKGKNNKIPSGVWSGGVWDGSISRIHFSGIDENVNQVEMIGNSQYEGKGAAWASLDGTTINKISFDYNVDPGDSFDAVGVMFNITETENTLEGYMLTMNVGYALLYRALGMKNPGYNNSVYMFTKYTDELLNNVNNYLNASFTRKDLGGAIIKFTYNKGTIIGRPNNNKKRLERVELIKVFDIGRISELNSKTENKPLFNGSISIEIKPDGFLINTSNETIKVDESNPSLNSFGFFSEHYSHACTLTGYFNLTNIKLDT